MPTLEMTHGPCDENKTHHGPGPKEATFSKVEGFFPLG